MKSLLLFFCFIWIHFFVYSQDNVIEFRKNQKAIRNFTCDEIDDLTKGNLSNKDSSYFYYFKARAQFCSSNYFEAYKSYLRVLKWFQGKNPILEAEIKIEIATCLSILNQKGDALNYFLQAKRVCEATDDRALKIKFHLAFGEYYRRYDDFKNAEKELRKGLSLNNSDLFYECSYLNRIAAVKSQAGPHDSSLYYSEKAIKLAYKLNNFNLIATSENELAYIFPYFQKSKECYSKYKIAADYWKKAGMNLYALDAEIAMGGCLARDFNDMFNSRMLLLNCLKTATKNNWYNSEMRITEYLHLIYREIGQKDSSHLYQIKYYIARENLTNLVYETNTSFVQIKFDQKNNETIISKQKANLKSKQKENFYYLILTLSIGTILILITYILFQQIKKKKHLKKEKIEQEIRNKNLELLLTEKTALLQEVHHRVKNNLQEISTLLEMQIKNVKETTGKVVLNDAYRRISSMSLIHEMLYTSENISQINTENFIKDLISKHQLTFNFYAKNIGVKCEIESHNLNPTDAISLGMILSELISNAYKHAYHEVDNPYLWISFGLKKDGNFNLLVQDNGNGFDFDNFNPQNKSFGIRLVHIFTKKLHGNINFMDNGPGLKINLEFKINE